MITTNTAHHPITKEYYEKLKANLPLLYVDAIDDRPVEGGFAITEASGYNDKGVILHTCFVSNGQSYSCNANIMRDSGYINQDYLDYEDSRGNKAFTV